MSSIDLQHAIADRINYLVLRVKHLQSSGDFRNAELLRQEGLRLGRAYREQETFAYVKDLINY
jgi:hypothetical protein